MFDTEGKVQARLETMVKGGMLVINANGGESSVIGIPEGRSGVGLRIFNKAGNLTAGVMDADDENGGVVEVVSKDRNAEAIMRITTENEPIMVVRHGRIGVAALGAETDGRGYFEVGYNGNPVAMLTTSVENPGAGRLTLDDPSGGWAVRAGFDGTHGDVCVGGKGIESRQASHCLWGSAVVGSLAK